MFIRRVVITWLAGWRDLFLYRLIPGYEARGWLVRKRLDHQALWALFRSTRFRCAVLSLVAVQLLALSLAWHWDLDGWHRDLLRAAPALMVLPWFATARKSAISSLLLPTVAREPDKP